MKKTFTVLLFLTILFSLSVPASAGGDVNITVTVPARHSITVECGTGGKVEVSGTEYTGSNIFTAERLGGFTVTAVPLEGFETDDITCATGSLTRSGNSASLESVTADMRITVTFRRTAPAVPVPVSGKDRSISAGAVVSGTAAQIDIDENELERLLDTDTGTETVTVDISQIGAGIDTAVIPTDIIRAIAGHTSGDGSPAELEILFPDAAVILDADALSALSGETSGSEIGISIRKIGKDELTAGQQAALDGDAGNHIFYEVTLSSGDSGVDGLVTGSAQIRLRYSPAAGEDISTVSVWHISADGSTEQVLCEYSDGYISFRDSHLRNYVVRPGVISGQTDPHCFICRWLGRDIAPWCVIIPAVLILSAICTATVFIIRKKNGNKHKSV